MASGRESDARSEPRSTVMIGCVCCQSMAVDAPDDRLASLRAVPRYRKGALRGMTGRQSSLKPTKISTSASASSAVPPRVGSCVSSVKRLTTSGPATPCNRAM